MSIKTPATERMIQDHIARYDRLRWLLMMPNYTPADWFECDLFCVTKAGYLHEHEIKLTVSDFRADAKKMPRKWQYGKGRVPQPGAAKYVRLESRDTAGPSRFSYVTPIDLIGAEDVPEWAGLKYYDPRSWKFAEIKPAPKLHRVTVPDKVIQHARSVCYYRFWNERLKGGAA